MPFKTIFKTIALSLILLFAYSNTKGQDFGVREKKTIVEADTFRIPKYSVKLSFLSAYSYRPSIDLSFEHRLKNNHRLMHEVGFLFLYDIPSNVKRHGGIKIRNEYRIPLRPAKKNYNLFVGLQQYQMHRVFRQDAWFNMLGGAYRQEFEYKKYMLHNALLGTFGAYRVGPKKSRFIFEWTISLGAEVRTIFNQNVPEGAEIIPVRDQFLFQAPQDDEPEGSSIVPAFLFTFRMGGIIK